jgi:hypothetical protein
MVIGADPTIDPRIVKHPPRDGTTFTMKKVQHGDAARTASVFD